jgi:hypothetical protein
MQDKERSDTGNIEQNSEQTILYQAGNPHAYIKIVAAMRDNGEVNTLFPIVEKLIENTKCNIFVFADGAGAKLLANRPGYTKLATKDVLVETANKVDEAGLILVSQSVDSGIDESLVSTALTKRGKKAIILAIEDLPSGDNNYNNVLSSNNPLLLPDWQCVMNEQSKRRLIKSRPNLNPNKIVVTGSPSFDNINLVEKENVKRDFRDKYRIGKNDKIVVWIGGYGEADSDSFKLFIDGINNLNIKDYRLIIRKHPNDKRNEEFFRFTTTDISDHLLDTTNETVNTVRQAADVVVSVYSTEAVKAVCEGTPTLLIMIPEFLRKSGDENFSFIIDKDGSSAVVRKKEEMETTLKKIFYDEKFKRNIKKKAENWKVDGKATERIINLINEINSK